MSTEYSYFTRYWARVTGLWYGEKSDEPPSKKAKSEIEPSAIKLNEKNSDCDWRRRENGYKHHTGEYVRKDNSMVVRRGEPVIFTAKLNRDFDQEKDVIKIDLRYGENPSLTDGSHIIVSKVDGPPSYDWGLEFLSVDGGNVEMALHSPANAFIGRYKCAIYLQTGDDHCLDEEPDLIFICNPWNETDETFMHNSDALDEYILNEHGGIWRGTTQYSSPCMWNFGQFEEDILDVALYLIGNDPRIKGKKGLQKTRDPVWLSRILSAGANSSEGGVLTGNWSGKYDGGVSPVTWSGSVKILQQYWETKSDVKFGQCWVFSGVMTTLLRTIGIPARSVTNFASAHDTDNTMTIDDFVDEKNNEVKGLSSDSVWNFHVWNEVWLRGTGHWPAVYAGWAAVDATPQEESRGMMQCGPAPLKAIKDGEIYVGYDTGFVFGEVNADRVTWVVEQDGDTSYIKSMGSRRNRSVGINISTKAIGSYSRHLLTDDYKYQEGTEEEREAFSTAYAFSSRPSYYSKFLDCEKDGKQVDIQISLEPEVPQNGEDLSISIRVANLTGSDISANVNSALRACFYTGEKRQLVAVQEADDETIAAEQSAEYSMVVPYTEYGGKFADDQMSMRLDACVTTGGKTYTELLEFQFFNKSSVRIEFDVEEAKLGEELTASVIFTNPLDIDLTNLTITIEGAGLTRPTCIDLEGFVEPKQEAEISLKIKPHKLGERMLLVDIDAQELKDLKGQAIINVVE
ncbi:Oidioi.mRNA.OKI2018_I69.XSR.g15999.t3.cds [Oikopleura dioica]|uniref:Oidioi.mRNA.OKI2018_I69.XSR.g15999.t3.cds n=1 Tax=Oikopleura dioica TaxID=34765 RepID=A0ABN7SEM8_OIKDI|nr:Oidioi.mRNA.OKI2018_I69.XSR.g15999.t3.cds [Oikopleura dioica]